MVDEREYHALNAGVSRHLGGVWNEDVLPVLEWEAPQQRLVVPVLVQQAWGVEEPVLRWSRSKRERNLREHHTDRVQIELIDQWMSGIFRAGPDPREGRFEYLAFLRIEGRLFRLVAGRDRDGSLNLVSVHGTTKARVEQQWQRLMAGGDMQDIRI